MRQGKSGIETELPMEGRYGVDPHATRQQIDSLVADHLGFRILSGDRIINLADIIVQGDGQPQNVAGNMADSLIQKHVVKVYSWSFRLRAGQSGEK